MPQRPMLQPLMAGLLAGSVSLTAGGAGPVLAQTAADQPVTGAATLPQIAPPRASLLAARQAPGGLTIPVDWVLTGAEPAVTDRIVLARPDDPAATFVAHSYPRQHPADLRLPLAPGDLELRYLVQPENGDPLIVGRQPLMILPQLVQLVAPARAGGGDRLLVGHDGPAFRADYIAIAEAGSPPDSYASYSYTGRGGPVPVVAPLTPGAYELRYIGSGADGEAVLARQPLQIDPALTQLEAPDSAVAADLLPVTWQGPANPRDMIALARPGSPADQYESYVLTSAGSPAGLRLPLVPGDWELRYIATGEDEYLTLASRPLRIEPARASLTAPDSVPQGSQIHVDFSGPGRRGDYITLAVPGSPATEAVSSAYVLRGTPARLRVPVQPGRYELRYVVDLDEDAILEARPVEVVAVPVSLDAPAGAGAGTVIDLPWSGPGGHGDALVMALPGAAPGEAITQVLPGRANPAQLRLPPAPGRYELRYVSGGAAPQVLAAQPIEVWPVTASLTAPAVTRLGAQIPVRWEGPGAKGDRITLAGPADPPESYLSSVWLGDQPEVSLTAPVAPGRYQLRYLSAGRILAEAGFEVEEVGASLTLEGTSEAAGAGAGASPAGGVKGTDGQQGVRLPAGALALVGWQGPGNAADRLVLARPGADPGEVLSHAYLRDGNPLRLRLPLEPGAYEIRYLAPGQPLGRILATMPVQIDAVTAGLSAPPEAPAGSLLRPDWQGPGHPGDRITIAKAGDPPGTALGFIFARPGDPQPLQLPAEPGDYELRYIARGTADQILARQMLRLTPVSASLTLAEGAGGQADSAPGAALGGSRLEVAWTGPGYRGDVLELVRSGQDQPVLSRPVVAGNPLRLTLPAEPGDYLLRYRLGQSGTVLAEHPLTVAAAPG